MVPLLSSYSWLTQLCTNSRINEPALYIDYAVCGLEQVGLKGMFCISSVFDFTDALLFSNASIARTSFEIISRAKSDSVEVS